MSKKKTDWQIIKGLADYIATFEGFKQERFFKGKKVKYSDAYDLSIYVDGSYISVHTCDKDGNKTNELSVHATCWRMPEIDKDGVKNIADLEMPDARKLNSFYRAKLRPIEKYREETRAEYNVRQITNLRAELAKLEGQDD